MNTLFVCVAFVLFAALALLGGAAAFLVRGFRAPSSELVDLPRPARQRQMNIIAHIAASSGAFLGCVYLILAVLLDFDSALMVAATFLFVSAVWMWNRSTPLVGPMTQPPWRYVMDSPEFIVRMAIGAVIVIGSLVAAFWFSSWSDRVAVGSVVLTGVAEVGAAVCLRAAAQRRSTRM